MEGRIYTGQTAQGAANPERLTVIPQVTMSSVAVGIEELRKQACALEDQVRNLHSLVGACFPPQEIAKTSDVENAPDNSIDQAHLSLNKLSNELSYISGMVGRIVSRI